MALNKEWLDTALSTIHKEGVNYFYSGQFVDLMACISIAKGAKLDGLDSHLQFINQNDSIREAKLHKLDSYLQFVHQDIWNLETIVLRLEYQKNLWTSEQLGDALWMQFAACDINLFHVEFRSIFDHLAQIIRSASDPPGQIPQSFNDLKKWVAKSDGNVEKLGEGLAEVVLSCGWFDDLKEVRDSIVHYGGLTLIVPKKGRILFQVIDETKMNMKVCTPEIMFNNSLVDFELYAGLYFGYLLAFLEKVSGVIYKRLNLKKQFINSKSYNQGLRVLHDWINQLPC